jgi:hypothetical protein
MPPTKTTSRSTKKRSSTRRGRHEASPKKKCKYCPARLHPNSINRHVRDSHPEKVEDSANPEASTPSTATSNGAASTMAQSKAVSVYLEECRQARIGKRRRSGVTLGRLEGFPAHTTDPAVVDRAIAEIEQRATVEPKPLREIQLRQRIMDLRAASAALSNGNGDEHASKDLFVKYASNVALRLNLSYEAFREMGVSAAVLKEAGIGR